MNFAPGHGGGALIEATIDRDGAQVRELLCAYPQSVSAKDSDGLTPLHWAILCGYADIVSELIRGGADTSAATAAGSTALHEAGRGGSLEVARLLLDDAPAEAIHAVTADGNMPLHEAARRGHVDICELMLNSGADINAVTASGSSALHWASMWGEAGVVELLIRHGADTTVLNRAGKSALDVVITVDSDANAAVCSAFEEVRSTPEQY